MKLFKVLLTHYAPKDSSTAIKEFLVAEDDKQLFLHLANGYTHWKDLRIDAESYYKSGMENNDQDDIDIAMEILEQYNDIYENKGDEREVYDLHYGATQYSWEEVETADEELINHMLRCGLATKVEIEN